MALELRIKDRALADLETRCERLEHRVAELTGAEGETGAPAPPGGDAPPPASQAHSHLGARR